MPSSEQFEDGMPKFDDAGREVMRAVADNSAGWRYVYRDETVLWGYQDYDATPAPAKAAKAATPAPAPAPAPATPPVGWGDPNATQGS